MKPREIFIYVEGPSDKYGLEKLLENVVGAACQKGVGVVIIPFEGKEPLLNKGPIKAVSVIRNKPTSAVFMVADLYPQNKPFKHETYDELKSALKDVFIKKINSIGLDECLKDRFFVHCFKYDLESLLLASESALMERLGINKFGSVKWAVPVEDQNHDRPPKRIVEELFEEAGKKYKDTSDVPWVLERSDYRELMIKCNQNFKPFIVDLMKVIESPVVSR